MYQRSKINFSLLIFGQFVSLIGERISLAVYISIVATLVSAQNSWTSNLLIMIQFLPLFLFGYIFGSFADVCNRKYLLIFSELLRISALVMLLFVQDNLYLIYSSVFLLGIGYALFEPARKSIMPFLVPHEKLKEWNKLYSVLEIIALLIGLAISAYILQVISINTAILIDIATYGVSIITISLIRYNVVKDSSFDEVTHATTTSFSRQLIRIKKGFDYASKNNNVKYALIVLFIHYLTISIFFAGLNDFVIKSISDPLNAGSFISYYLLFAAIGAVLSYPLLQCCKLFLESTITVVSLLSGTILFILFTIMSTTTNIMELFILEGILIGLGIIGGVQYLRFTYILQLQSKKEYLGRVMALLELIVSFTIVFGIGVGLVLSEVLNYTIVFVICSVLYLICSLVMLYVKKVVTW